MPFFSQDVNLLYRLTNSCLGVALVQIRCTYFDLT
jgi:hypothetical protein